MRSNVRQTSTALAAIILLGALTSARGQYVEDSIDVGGWGVTNLTYNAGAGVVYGGCYYGHSFFAISCSTNEVVSQFEVVRPQDVAYAPLVNKAYCGLSNQGEDSILIIDGTSHTRIRAIPVKGAGFFAIDTLVNRLYFTCYVDDKVGVLDCETDSVLTYISIPGEPVHLTINTRRRKLYCQNDYNMTVSVIDMNTNQVIRDVYTGSWYFAECYSEVADKYYCSFVNGASGVTVIDGTSDSVTGLIPLPQGYAPSAMVSVEPDSLVMVAAYSGGADSVYAIDVLRGEVSSAVRVGSDPRAFAYSRPSRVVYCANTSWDNLSVISSDGLRVLGAVQVGDGPQTLLACTQHERLYVGHGGRTNWLYIIRDRVGVTEQMPVAVPATTAPTTVIASGTGSHFFSSVPAKVQDVVGRNVFSVAAGANDLSRLAPGIYVIVVGRGVPPRKLVKLR